MRSRHLNMSQDLTRLSINQMSISRIDLSEAVEACARADIAWIGVWRHKIVGPAVVAGRHIREAGLRVSSLCRGGMFPAATADERRSRIEDNLRAIDEAVAIGTDLLVLVNGPAPNRDLAAARRMVEEGIAEIEPYAKACKVRLGIEPLHPMFAADRSVTVTLAQANQLAAQFDPRWVGVVVDVYHVWWDPQIYTEIARAGERVFAFHVSDWIIPLPDILTGRGIMGQGVIEIRKLREAVEAAGYRGPVEVEIFNQNVWKLPVDDALRAITAGYLEAT